MTTAHHQQRDVATGADCFAAYFIILSALWNHFELHAVNNIDPMINKSITIISIDIRDPKTIAIGRFHWLRSDEVIDGVLTNE